MRQPSEGGEVGRAIFVVGKADGGKKFGTGALQEGRHAEVALGIAGEVAEHHNTGERADDSGNDGREGMRGFAQRLESAMQRIPKSGETVNKGNQERKTQENERGDFEARVFVLIPFVCALVIFLLRRNPGMKNKFGQGADLFGVCERCGRRLVELRPNRAKSEGDPTGGKPTVGMHGSWFERNAGDVEVAGGAQAFGEVAVVNPEILPAAELEEETAEEGGEDEGGLEKVKDMKMIGVGQDGGDGGGSGGARIADHAGVVVAALIVRGEVAGANEEREYKFFELREIGGGEVVFIGVAEQVVIATLDFGVFGLDGQKFLACDVITAKVRGKIFGGKMPIDGAGGDVDENDGASVFPGVVVDPSA